MKNTIGKLMPSSTTIATAVLFGICGTAAMASANTEIFDTSCNFLNQIMEWIFGVAYVLGAIGLVTIAVSAFLGRFKFSHLIALGGGLFIVAMADLLIGFATSGAQNDSGCYETAML